MSAVLDGRSAYEAEGGSGRVRNRQILAAGLFGCFLLAAGILLTIVCFVKEQKAVSAAVMEPVQLDLCLLHPDRPGTREQVTGLFPGENMVWKPAVILDGTSPEAYIRVRLKFGGILADSQEESEEEKNSRLERIQELCAGIRFCDGWTKGSDGYYYYQEAVAPGSVVQICDQLTIPENWDNSVAEKLFTIEVSAEAICLDGRESWISLCAFPLIRQELCQKAFCF